MTYLVEFPYFLFKIDLCLSIYGIWFSIPKLVSVHSYFNVSIQTKRNFYFFFSEFDEEGNEYGLRFLITADWGGQSEPPYTTPIQLNLAKAMGDFALRYRTKYILSLGDNFCDDGVKNVDDHRFKVSYFIDYL